MTKVMVREGRLVVPACPSCNCRLTKDQLGYYVHFRKWVWWVNKDASGCKCSLIDDVFTVVKGIVTPAWGSK